MKSILKIILEKLIGFLVFLIMVGLANVISKAFDNYTFDMIIEFLNSNIGLLFSVTLLFMIGEIFWQFRFPINVPTPIFNAIASYLLVVFLFRIFTIIDVLAGVNISDPFSLFAPWVHILVVIIVLVSGYGNIMSRARREKSRSEIRAERKLRKERRKSERKRKVDHKKAKRKTQKKK